MTAFLTTAQNIENIQYKHESEETDSIISNQYNVPDWKIGNYWTYEIDNFTVEYEEPDFTLNLDGDIDNLHLEVINVFENTYELSLEATFGAFYEINTVVKEGPIKIIGELKNTNLDGTIIFNKTDLGINQINIIITGKLLVDIDEQPFIQFPFKLRRNIDMKIVLDLEFNNSYLPIIKFPFELGENWGIPANDIILTGSIESPDLVLINNLNNIINPIFHIINDTIGIDISKLVKLSDILYDILPVIDISHLLNEIMDVGNVFPIPEVLPIICFFGKDDIKVPARELPFDACNISFFGTGLGNIYYAPDAGNIIKITGNFEEVLPFINNINAELIDYQYTP
jgi:hypothetical protein